MKKFLLLFAMVAALALPSRAAYYIVGDAPFGGWNPDNGVEMMDNGDGTYSYTVTISGGVYFVLADGKSSDWAEFNPNYRLGPVSNNNETVVLDTWVAVQKNDNPGGAFFFNGNGNEYTITFDENNYQFKVEGQDTGGGEDEGGISIYVKADEPPMFYTWIDNGDQPVGGWPGIVLTETATVNRIDYYVYTYDPMYTSVNVILNNGGWGAGNQTGDFVGITEDAFFIYNGSGFAYGLIPPEVYGNPTGEYAFYVNTDHWSQVYAVIDGASYPMTKVGVDGAGYEVYKWEGELDYTPSRITFNDGMGHGVVDAYGSIYDDEYVKGGYYVYTFYAAKETAYLDKVAEIIYEGEDQVPVLEDCAIKLFSSDATWNTYENVMFEITGTYFNQSARKGDVYYSVDGGQYVKFAENLNSEDSFAEQVTLSFDHNAYTHTITLISRDESNAKSEVVTVLEAVDVKALNVSYPTSFDFTGEPINFEPEVSYNGEHLTLGEDYYAFIFNNDAPGTGTLHLEGVSMSYIGSKDFYFTINPQAQTGAPTFSGYTMEGIHAYFVEIIPTEPSVIYYRVQYEYPNGVWTDWYEYEDLLSFTEDGTHRIEAYAVAQGKLPSEIIGYEFELGSVQPDVTDAPVINWTAVDGVLTVTATGNGNVVLNVGNETAMGEGSATITVNYDIYEGIEIGATAYAQEDGKLPSVTVEENIVVEAVQPDVTDAPVITWTAVDGVLTVTATGNGNVVLNVGNETAMGEGSATITVNYDIYEGIEIGATAYAQEDGKLPSATVEKNIVVEAVQPEVTDAPVISWTAVDGVLTVTATGNGNVVLNVGNETANGEDSATITINYDTYEGIEIGATAYAQEDGKLPSETVEKNIVVEAVQPQVTPTPSIVVTPDADNQGYTIEAVGEGDVHLYINGEEVDNPYHIDRTDENIELDVVATAEVAGMEMSQAEQLVVIPAFQGQGYFIVLVDQDGVEHTYQLYQSANNEYNYVNMFTLEFNPWGAFDYDHGEPRPDVPFYFIVNGERLGAVEEYQAAAMGELENTLQNPLFANNNYYTVPVGYTYTIGIQILPQTGDMYVLVAQGGRVGVDEVLAGKEVSSVRYFNMAGQEMQEANGICIAVTTYTDGTTSTVKVMK